MRYHIVDFTLINPCDWLPMMLTASYNFSLSLCQLVVDLLFLDVFFCFLFFPMVTNLCFCKRSLHNYSAKMHVSKFQIKVRYVIGIKFDTSFPFSVSFPVNVHLGKLFSWRDLSDWSAAGVQVAQVFDPVSLNTMRPLGFSSSTFSFPASLLF